MKKLLAILLTCVITMVTMVIPASADSIYYPCYEGSWYLKENNGTPVKLEIYNVTNSDMGIYFQYGQFAVYVNDAQIDGSNVYGEYYEVWEGGDFIVSGSISMSLGDQSIWLDWHPYENGRDCGVKGFMFYNSSFSYKTVSESNVKVVLDGKQLEFDQNPVTMNDRVLVPIRAIAEAMGAEVSWDYGVRKVGSMVGITKGVRYISFCVEDTGYNENYNPFHMMIRDGSDNGRFITLDAPVIIYNDRTLVPVRAVSEAFDANVSWDGNTQTVNISTQ